MKKKIGNLTLKEMRNICADRFKKGFPYCKDCPIYCVCGLSPDDMKREDLDKEIEVEEDEVD